MIFFQKKVRKNLQVPKNVSTFASQLRNKPLTSRLNNGIWCNGNTADSGPAFPGSSPGIPTQSIHLSKMDAFFVYNKYPILLFLRNFAWNRRSAAFYRKKDSEDFKKTSVYFNNI